MTPADVAKQRFRELGDHVREVRCCTSLKAVRDREHFKTIFSCPCDEKWVFTDVALREAPYILDYLRLCGLDILVEPILNHRTIPGAWGKVLVGFIDE